MAGTPGCSCPFAIEPWSPDPWRNPIEDVAVDIVAEQRRFLRNAWRWLSDWIPGRKAYVDYHKSNFWTVQNGAKELWVG